ncbi:Transcription factor MYC/MYB N-terminal protein [Dioscorea alata]|uniref:Transcription factor MYC/MYB N-terminal protein n=1 Tax=Dioscorea alata TaxID=55571 RepID=A0ACB7VC04_DIOAL|nr:Transcription factor MYC/MYB N-terminal protein [Dioscorea alata]
MGLLLRDALRRLCVEIGWSYAVFWRSIGSRNPMHLVWSDGHCERPVDISGFDAMDMLLKERGAARSSGNDRVSEIRGVVGDRLSMLVKTTMASQVHVVGDGIIGKAALTGNHWWILRDLLDGSTSDCLGEMRPQFLAGIQTIAIIPVLPFGVVQLGSTQSVIENIGFVSHVRCLFSQFGHIPGALSCYPTQNVLGVFQGENSQMHASPAITTANCPSKKVCEGMGRSLPSIADGCSPQPGRSSSRVSVSQPSYTSLVHGKLESGASKVAANDVSTPTVHSEMCQQIIDPVINPVHLNNPLERVPMEVQKEFGMPFVSSDHPTSRYSGSLEGSPVNNREPLRRRSNRFISSIPLTDLDDIALFDGMKSLVDANAIGKTGSLPSGIKETLKIPFFPARTGPSHIKNGTKDANSQPMFVEDSKYSGSVKQGSQNVVTSRGQEEDNNLFEAADILPTELGKQGSSYNSCFGALPDCWINSSDPFTEERQYPNTEFDTGVLVNSQNNISEKSGHVNAVTQHSSQVLLQPSSGNDLFDVLGVEYKSNHCHASLDEIGQGDQFNAIEMDTGVSTCFTQLDTGSIYDSLNYENSCNGNFLEDYHDQLLDAVVSKAKSSAKQNSDDNVSCKTSITNISNSSLCASPASGWVSSSEQMENNYLGLLPMLLRTEAASSGAAKSACSSDKTEDCHTRNASYKSQVIPCIENGQNIKRISATSAPNKQVDDTGKLTRKRSRPGESPRPRPKDRQMIQDRVKELREIVPNGAKCSIDALLEKTIKHMLFLQSVTKHADKLKETGEPKIVNKEGGILLKDNFEGGATWAFEVGNQSMVCPIIVEDLNPPRQMLVEMLCEERGLFLEIADLIRGLGLTILKGVMEARDDKIWARFAVEANRDVTRMEIFLSLVRLLEPTMGGHIVPVGIDNASMPQILVPQCSIPATGLSDRLG